jgi:hypothetical protein
MQARTQCRHDIMSAHFCRDEKSISQARQGVGVGSGPGRRGGWMMEYDAILSQVVALLQRERRIAYRVLKRRLQLDDDLLEALKET